MLLENNSLFNISNQNAKCDQKVGFLNLNQVTYKLKITVACFKILDFIALLGRLVWILINNLGRKEFIGCSQWAAGLKIIKNVLKYENYVE